MHTQLAALTLLPAAYNHRGLLCHALLGEHVAYTRHLDISNHCRRRSTPFDGSFLCHTVSFTGVSVCIAHLHTSRTSNVDSLLDADHVRGTNTSADRQTTRGWTFKTRAVFPSSHPISADVVMNDISVNVNKGAGDGPSGEAVELLLSIASMAADAQSPSQPFQKLEEKDPPDSTFPYTPPDDLHPVSPRVQSIPHHSLLPDSDLEPSTPKQAMSDVVPKSTKSKRRRNAQGSPSSPRNASERRSTDPLRPPHWMGEDNSMIRCICGHEEDDGFTIQCEGCGAWEHGLCFGYLDESSAPDTYFCELCAPRPFDAESARKSQAASRATGATAAAVSQSKDRPKSRNKPKRQRTGTLEVESEAPTTQPKDVMGPPSAKPKRKSTANKPRIKQRSIREATPTSFPFREQSIVEVESEYFRNPWQMEYTPINNSIVSTKKARMAMAELYHEWLDADLEDLGSKRTIVDSSGLPSPTDTGASRLSPDHGFTTPDFDILAPPVPPVFLAESHPVPISIKTITEDMSFLPLNYEDEVNGAVYTRPAIYGVFVDERVGHGGFVGEYRGTVIDGETYRRDPINQYPGLGMPKPFVHCVGPPVNLMIDARGYGSELRFTRSGCHPNAILRPVLWRREAVETRLKFCLFASRAINKGEEVILGWEWDDAHVVHSIQHAVMSLIAPPSDHTLADVTLQHLAEKYDGVLSHMFGTFTACACKKPTHCALQQMRLIASDQPPKVSIIKGKARLDFGELIGAVRGWRRQEAESETPRRWNPMQEIQVGDTRSRSISIASGEDADVNMGGEVDTSIRIEANDDDGEQSMGMDEDESSPSPAAVAPSSSLSSLPPTSRPTRSIRAASPIAEDDDGNVSDATSATEPRSHFSDPEDELTPRKSMSPPSKPVPTTKAKRKTPVKKESKAVHVEENSSASTRPAPRRGRKANRVASSASEDETLPVTKASRKADQGLASLFEDSEKLAGVPEQTVAPMAKAMEITDVPADTSTEQFAPTEEARMDVDTVIARDPTPPREPTPPLRQPTPEPPKKVSLSDYLKNHRIRKDSSTAIATPSAPEIIAPTPINEIDAGGDVPEAVDVKPDVESANGPINYLQFLPPSSARAPDLPTPNGNSGSILESPMSTGGFTPGVNTVPPSDYFPPQPPSSSFVPRTQSASYVPRQASLTDGMNGDDLLSVPNHVPRQSSVSSNGSATANNNSTWEDHSRPTSSYVPRQPSYDNSRVPQTPPKPTIPLASETAYMNDRYNTPPFGPRNPPTGPKAALPPPTGPRGNSWQAPAPPAPNRPMENGRGFAAAPGPRGFGGRSFNGPSGPGGLGERGYGDRDGFGDRRGGAGGGGFGFRGGPPFRGRGMPR